MQLHHRQLLDQRQINLQTFRLHRLLRKIKRAWWQPREQCATIYRLHQVMSQKISQTSILPLYRLPRAPPTARCPVRKDLLRD